MSEIHMNVFFFCQQDTTQSTRVLKARMKAQEIGILKQSSSNNTDGASDPIERNKLVLRNLLEECGKGVLIGTRFSQLNNIDKPHNFFFGLEGHNFQMAGKQKNSIKSGHLLFLSMRNFCSQRPATQKQLKKSSMTYHSS